MGWMGECICNRQVFERIREFFFFQQSVLKEIENDLGHFQA